MGWAMKEDTIARDSSLLLIYREIKMYISITLSAITQNKGEKYHSLESDDSPFQVPGTIGQTDPSYQSEMRDGFQPAPADTYAANRGSIQGAPKKVSDYFNNVNYFLVIQILVKSMRFMFLLLDYVLLHCDGLLSKYFAC